MDRLRIVNPSGLLAKPRLTAFDALPSLLRMPIQKLEKAPLLQTGLPLFTFAFVGLIFPLNGTLVNEFAQSLSTRREDLGFISSLFIAFHALGLVVSGLLAKKTGPRVLGLVGAALCALGGLLLVVFPSLGGFFAENLLFGLGSGVLVTVGNYLVIHYFPEKGRAARLSVLNAFFCVGSVLMPFIASGFVAAGLGWAPALIVLGLVALLVVLGFGLLKLGAAPSQSGEGQAESPESAAPKALKLARGSASGAGLLSYVLFEFTLTYWLVSWCRDILGAGVAESALALSIFWMAVAVSRAVSGLVLRRMHETSYLIVLFILVCAGFALVLSAPSWLLLAIGVAVCGLGCGAIYPTLVAYGTRSAGVKTSLGITLFLTFGPIGGILALPLSGAVMLSGGLRAAMETGIVVLGVLGFLVMSLVLLRLLGRRSYV